METENQNDASVRKILLILSKASLENVYASFIFANGARMEGIEAEIFFTFFGLEALHKTRMKRIHVATVGNPGLHIPTMLGGLPGMEALTTRMLKKEMAKLEIPSVEDFLYTLHDAGTRLWACNFSMQMFHFEAEDLFEETDGILTVGQFYDRAKGEGTHLMFI
jgi:peroxiredoxin family protein